MRKLAKKDLRIVGSAGSLADLVAMIEGRMYWKIVSVRPSEQFAVGRKQVFDVETSKGVSDRALIVKDGARYKLYFVNA